MSGGKTEAGAKGGKEVVAIGIFIIGGDADEGLGGRTDGGGGGDGRDGDRYRKLIKWEDTAENISFGIEHNAPLVYDHRLELYHPIMSTLEEHRGQLEREIEIIAAGCYLT